MSKRLPSRRVSTRKARHQAPVQVEHLTLDKDTVQETNPNTAPVPEQLQTSSIPQEKQTPQAPGADSRAAGKDQPTAEDYDSLTEGTTDIIIEPEAAPENPQQTTALPEEAESTTALPEEAENTTALPEDIRPSITTAASLIASSSSTAIPSSSTTTRKHRVKKTKQDLFKEYMFGIGELDDMPDKDDVLSIRQASIKHDARFRMNRTYDLRKSCNTRRMNFSRMMPIEEDDSVTEESSKRSLGFIPPNLFREPRITVRPTLGSRFRFLYNRRPQGVKVYFKHVKTDPKDRPPFVSATRI